MQETLIRVLARLTGLPNPPLTVPEVADFGHFATPVALQLGKERKQNPMGIAAELSLALVGDPELSGIVLNAEVASPGFLNIRLTPEAHQRALSEILAAGPRVPQAHAGEKAIVEYASPNAAKPLHVGHLRNIALGASFARIFEATGMQVTRWNYLGDWGTQFGKVIVAYGKWGDAARLEADPIGELVSLYVRFVAAAKDDPSLDQEARDTFRKLELGDPETRGIWERFRTLSIEATRPAYEELSASFDLWEGEASLESKIGPINDLLREKGLLEPSEGAQIVRLDEENLPVALIIKSDGASLYLSRDLALLKERMERFPGQRIFHVVGNEQTLNFQQLKAIAARLGWPQELVMHLKYGLLLDRDGKKFSTREGNTVDASDVLDEAEARVAKIAAGREEPLPPDVIRTIAVNAVSYAMTKDVRTSDIRFDWDRMLDFHGDSGPYLQYTYARLARLIGKAEVAQVPDLARLVEPSELELVRTLDQYGATVLRAADDLQTSHLALYLYQLASKANAYYQSVPVLKDDDAARRDARVALLGAVRDTLAAGMGLLGIRAVERI